MLQNNMQKADKKIPFAHRKQMLECVQKVFFCYETRKI